MYRFLLDWYAQVAIHCDTWQELVDELAEYNLDLYAEAVVHENLDDCILFLDGVVRSTLYKIPIEFSENGKYLMTLRYNDQVYSMLGDELPTHNGVPKGFFVEEGNMVDLNGYRFIIASVDHDHAALKFMEEV